MAEWKHGAVTLELVDDLMPPERAGKMDALEVSRIPKAPLGLGQVCEDTADGIEKAGDKFQPPPDISAETLRRSGMRAEKIAQVIRDVEITLHTLRQASLLFDDDAYEQLRKVNDQIKAQARHNPELWEIFKPTRYFFTRARRRRRTTPPSNPGSGTAPASATQADSPGVTTPPTASTTAAPSSPVTAPSGTATTPTNPPSTPPQG